MHLARRAFFPRAQIFCVSVAAAISLSACGSGSAVAVVPASSMRVAQCNIIQSTARDAESTRTLQCGGGGGYEEIEKLADGSMTTATWDQNYAHAVVGSATSSAGVAEGTASAVMFNNSASNMGATYTTQTVALQNQTIKFTVPNWQTYVAGANTLPGGAVMVVNEQTNTATADFTANGIAYHLASSLESDGDHVDVTFTQSNGVQPVTERFATSQLVPSAMAGTGRNLGNARSSLAARHTLASAAAKVAAVSGLIAAGAACVAVFFPPAAAIAAPVAAVAGVIAATAVVVDAFGPEQPRPL